MSTTEISLINNTGNRPNSPRKHTLEISESGANIHLANESTPTMAPVITSKDMTARITNGNKMENANVKNGQQENRVNSLLN